jgi:hypothetical protein
MPALNPGRFDATGQNRDPAGFATIAPYAMLPFDTDFYLKTAWVHASTDELVERVNNDLQLLWRAGQGGRVSPKLWQKLDARMKLWVDFKQQYDDAVFRRAADPFDWFGRDYDSELRGTWVPWVLEMIRAFAEEPAAADALDSYGLVEGADQLEQRAQPPAKSDGGGSFGLILGVVVTVGLIGAGVYLARR